MAARALKRSLRRVRTEQALAADGLKPGPVHDLRVALRRCRSLAERFSDLNPHPVWRHLRKACKDLLRGLADLRDTQVEEAWVRRLGLGRGPAGAASMSSLEVERRHARRSARRALADFPGKRWKRWSRRLPERAGRIQPRKRISPGWRCGGSRKLVSANGTGAKAGAVRPPPFARCAETLSLLARKLSSGAAGALERGSKTIAGTARGRPRPRCVAPADSPDLSCGRSRSETREPVARQDRGRAQPGGGRVLAGYRR